MELRDIENTRLLNRIRIATGVFYPEIGSIDTSRRVIAQGVLPLLVKSLNDIRDPGVRNAVYSRLATIHARPWFEDIFNLWKTEEDRLAKSLLNVALARAVDAEHSIALWKAVQKAAITPNHFLLVSRLYRFDHLRTSVQEYILSRSDQIDIGDLEDVLRIGDPQVSLVCGGRLRALRRTRGDGLAVSITPSTSGEKVVDGSRSTVKLNRLEGELASRCKAGGLSDAPAFSGLAVSLVPLPQDAWFEVRSKSEQQSQARILVKKIAPDRVEIVLQTR